METAELDKNLLALLEKEKSEMQKPNLLVVGGTGVGKSSLINLVFGKEVARVGNGKPITKGIDRYEVNDFPLVLYDAEGYEITASGEADNGNFGKVKISAVKLANKLS